MLESDDYTKTAFRDVIPNQIDGDGVEIPPPSHEEVNVAIMQFKNDGLMAFPLNYLRPNVMSW